jgi:hypothetical protein
VKCGHCHHESHPNLDVALVSMSGDVLARELFQVPNPPERGSWTVLLDLPTDQIGRTVACIVGPIVRLTVSSSGRTYCVNGLDLSKLGNVGYGG